MRICLGLIHTLLTLPSGQSLAMFCAECSECSSPVSDPRLESILHQSVTSCVAREVEPALEAEYP